MIAKTWPSPSSVSTNAAKATAARTIVVNRRPPRRDVQSVAIIIATGAATSRPTCAAIGISPQTRKNSSTTLAASAKPPTSAATCIPSETFFCCSETSTSKARESSASTRSW